MPEVTSPPPSIGMPCRGTAFSSITNAVSLRCRPLVLDPAQLGRAGEVLREVARPAEPGRDRIRVGGDVIAVQRITHLEPERVTCAEAAGRRPVLDDRVPQLDRVLGGAHQLDAFLARIAGAADHHLDAVELAHGMGESGRLRQAEGLDRCRPLHREERVLVRRVSHLGAPDLALLDPPERRLPVARVDDEQRVAGAEPVGDQVVDDAAALVREQRVLRLAVAEPAEVVREQALQQVRLPRPLDVQLAHMGDVEDAPVAADGEVLRDHALVLDGHLPAGEGNHSRAERHVAIVQRSAPESFVAHRATIWQ